jgi:hypothetical protein
VSAITAAVRDDLVAHITERAPADPRDEPGRVEVSLWRATDDEPVRFRRRLSVPVWSEIATNYPERVAKRLAELMKMGPPAAETAGRLVLWHGAAGTGKTTAIRALADAWRPWADVHYVMDPEKFFGSADYLCRVLLGDDEEDEDADSETRWKLVVVEDASEFLVGDAKHEAGAALGRLLNLTDGILGQALDAITLVTTNEPIGRLHSAVARPGRCLADVEFAPFSRSQARCWLGEAIHPTGDSMTLSELFHLRGDVARVSTKRVDDGMGGYA